MKEENDFLALKIAVTTERGKFAIKYLALDMTKLENFD